MKFENILVIVIGSVVLGVLGGFAARSWWIGICLPIVLIVFGVMWLAIKSAKPEEPRFPEEKKEVPPTKVTQE